jgi:hypothetical protein
MRPEIFRGARAYRQTFARCDLTGPALRGVAAFVDINEIEKRLDVFAAEEATFADAHLQPFMGFVSPATFNHEHIPDVALFVSTGAAGSVAPGEDLFVGLTGEHLFYDLGVANPEEAAAP